MLWRFCAGAPGGADRPGGDDRGCGLGFAPGGRPDPRAQQPNGPPAVALGQRVPRQGRTCYLLVSSMWACAATPGRP